MKSILLYVCIILISSNISGQTDLTTNYIDQINDHRLMYYMEDLSEEDLTFMNSIGLVLRYTTEIGNIGIFEATQIPVTHQNDVLSNVIEINTTVREETGAGSGSNGTTEQDNYDFKSVLSIPDSESSTTNPVTDYCLDYDYHLTPDRSVIKVGIFDTGINNDFPVAYQPLNIEVNKTYLNDVVDANEAIDDHNHGTHVAHIVQAISGSAKKNFIEYYDYKILDNKGSGYMADLIIAVDQAVSRYHVNILNLSLSYVGHGPNSFLDRFFKILEAENVLVISSAGNEETELNQNSVGLSFNPTNFISVGSIDCHNTISSFSNYGELLDIYMAGEDINSYNRFGIGLEYSGTSQATAILTGLAASLASKQDNFWASQIKCALITSVENNSNATTGTVNANIANDNLSNTCLSPTGYALRPQNTSDSSLQDDLNFYPNPATESINFTLSKGSYLIMLNDISGKTITSKTIVAHSDNYKSEINIDSNYQSGMYSINVYNELTKMLTTKVIMINK